MSDKPTFAMAALAALQHIGMPVDDASFRNVARVSQIMPPGIGLIVRSIETLALFCERGGFTIVFTPEGKMQARMPTYITTTHAPSGHFAVMMWWNPENDGFYEPYNTGAGRYRTREPACEEAIAWAQAEGVEYRK